jgi:hypothetical protein
MTMRWSGEPFIDIVEFYETYLSAIACNFHFNAFPFLLHLILQL